MKKQLLASTMLVAAGALASGVAQAKFDVTVNGYQEGIVGIQLQSDTDLGYETSTLDVDYDGEIHFNARTELDNGIAIRAHVELENGHGTGSDRIDEEYIIVRGNFGQITIGAEDNAGHLMTIGYSGSWATGVGQNLSFDIGDFINRGSGTEEILWDNRLVAGDNDSTKITYYSPRMGGFQIGASYIPTFNQDTNSATGPGSNADTEQHDGIALGANFQRKFGNFGLGVGVGYIQAAGAQNGAAPDDEDTEAYNVGARFDFGPARIAVGYKVIDNSPGGSAQTGTNIDLGGRLTFGPNRFSLTYIMGENDIDEEVNRYMLSYARTLGPGVSLTANYMWNESETATTSIDGSAISTSIKLRF